MATQFIHKLRYLLFSPESRFELLARSFYHRMAATKLYFLVQDWLAKRSYRRFLNHQKNQVLPEPGTLIHQPKITFLLNRSNASGEDLQLSLASIQALQGDNWEVITPYSDGNHFEELPSHFTTDSRIRWLEQNQKNILDSITGDYVIFCEDGDQFFHPLLIHFYQALSDEVSPDLVYYDCEWRTNGRGKTKPFFKPSALSPALMLSVNYASRGFIKLSSLKTFIDTIDPTLNLQYQEYNFVLKLHERKASWRHLPFILLSQNALPTPDNPETSQAITDHLSRQGLQEAIALNLDQGTRFIWKSDDPSIAIIILTRNHRQLLETLINSIFAYPYKQPINITIVDNASDDKDALEYHQQLSRLPNIKVVPYPKPFNYSEAINLGVANSDSDLILLMNDDMEVINGNWIPELAQWAIRSEVGVVGAKLIRANHTIQHIGIIMGLTGFMGHIYLNAPEHYFGLWGSADWYRDILAVTGACQMMRREVFDQVGGYDEGYRMAFGDIDFCLRVHGQGYRNIFTPFASLYHYEGLTRGYITPVSDILLGYERMENYLIDEDPYFSPNLTYTRIPKCTLKGHSKALRLAQIEERKKFYTK